MPLPFRINWYDLYGAAVDAAWLTALVIRHAAVLTSAAVALRAAEQASQRGVCFIDVDESSRDTASAAFDDGDDVPDDAPFALHLDSAARRIFRVPRIRPRQKEAMMKLVFDEE